MKDLLKEARGRNGFPPQWRKSYEPMAMAEFLVYRSEKK